MKQLLWLGSILLAAVFACAQASDRVPLSLHEVEDLLTGGVPQKRVVTLVQQYGVQFVPNDAAVAELRDKGAGDDVIEAIREKSVAHSLKTAQDLVDKGLLDDAEISLNNAVAVDSSDPKLWTQLGDIQLRNHHSDRALTSYNRAHQLFPESSQISLKLADASIDNGNASNALSLCRDIARITPEDPEVHLCLARSMVKLGDSDAAIREADKASLLGSKDPALYSISPNIVMARFIKAVGGALMLRTVHSIHQVGFEEYNSPKGVIPYDTEGYLYFPDRGVDMLKSTQANIDQRTVFSPGNSFITNGRQWRDLNDNEKASYAAALATGIIAVAINYNQPGYTYKAAGTQLIDGRLAAIVDISTGQYSTRWFIDADKGTLLRTERAVNGHTYDYQITSWLSSEGISLPSHTVNSVDGKLAGNYELKSFELNPPDNPTLFTKPAGAVAVVPGNSGNRPRSAPAGSSRVLVASFRTPAHHRQSSQTIYEDITEDLMMFCRDNRVPLANDNARPLDLGQRFNLRTAVAEEARLGASNLMVITVDRPFSAWVKITVQYYDQNGGLAWEENSDARGLIEMGPPGIRRALDKMRAKLMNRIKLHALQTY